MTNPIHALSEWFDRQQDVAYLKTLSRPGCSDIGLSRAELIEFANGKPETRDRMLAMTEALGVDTKKIDAERWRHVDMVRNCTSCAAVRQCEDWLHMSAHKSDTPNFCPNLQHFNELMDDLLPRQRPVSDADNSAKEKFSFLSYV